MQDRLGDHLIEVGFGADDVPNSEGLMLESLIDEFAPYDYEKKVVRLGRVATICFLLASFLMPLFIATVLLGVDYPNWASIPLWAVVIAFGVSCFALLFRSEDLVLDRRGHFPIKRR